MGKVYLELQLRCELEDKIAAAVKKPTDPEDARIKYGHGMSGMMFLLNL